MTQRRRHPVALLLGILVAVLCLAGCRGRSRPVQPTETPPPAPTSVPVTPTPQGWVQHEGVGLTISLPEEWQVVEFGAGDLEAVFAEFRKTNPDLAGIIGSAEALQGVALWAFRADDPQAIFVDNLNIRRTPLGAQSIDSMEGVVAPVVAQYRQLGFQVAESRADLVIGGLPTAHIAYSFPVAGSDGKPIIVGGHQYLIAAPTDLWILSYAASPGNETALLPVIESSARSFRTR